MQDRDGGAQDAPHGSKGQRVAAHLARLILAGGYAPGQRLIEAELTQELGVGRGLLREALRLVAADGLVEIVPNRGAVVRRLSRCDALELFEIRTELEALAARRAAANMADPCTREAFRRATAGLWSEGPRAGLDAYIGENRAFHEAVLAASGNRQLMQLHEKLQLALLLSQVRGEMDPAVMRTSLAEHRGIAGAILAGDGKAAEAAIRAHLGRAAAMMQAMPAHAFRPEGRGRGLPVRPG